MTRVFLVRHGETEWNQNTPGYCGWSDIPLNAKGRAQAEAVAGRLAEEGLAAVFTSDLVRARHTAEAIAARVGNVRVEVDARFRELNYGLWEGKDPKELEQEDPEQFRAWKRDPAAVPTRGGETLRQVVDRAVPALEEALERYQGRTIALVAHKTTVRLLLCWALGVPLNEYIRILQQNAAINVIEIHEGARRIALVNDTCHLPGDLCSPAV